MSLEAPAGPGGGGAGWDGGCEREAVSSEEWVTLCLSGPCTPSSRPGMGLSHLGAKAEHGPRPAQDGPSARSSSHHSHVQSSLDALFRGHVRARSCGTWRDGVAVGFQSVPSTGPQSHPVPTPTSEGRQRCVSLCTCLLWLPVTNSRIPAPGSQPAGGNKPAQALPGPSAAWAGAALLSQHSFACGSSFVFRVSYGASFTATTKSPERAGGNCGDRLWSRETWVQSSSHH